MIRLHVTHNLNSTDLRKLREPLYIINSRKLSKAEVRIAQKLGLKKVYLPPLTEKLERKFFSQFDLFWDNLINGFDKKHFYWRYAISSKMQEWEESVGYLALKLFTLTESDIKIEGTIISICSSIEEVKLWEEWGHAHGWRVNKRKENLLRKFGLRVYTETLNLWRFIYFVLVCLYYKIHAPVYENRNVRGQQSVLIVSLLYADSFKNNRYRDPFFGKLHEFLKASGTSCTYLCQPLDSYRETVRQVKNCTKTRIIVPYSVLSWSDILGVALKLLLRRIKLPSTFFDGCDFAAVLRWNARRFDFFFNFHSEITFAAVALLSTREEFDQMIHLYEGNVFERASIQAYNGKGKKTGYSHGVVFSQNLKLRITNKELSRRPMFDEIICTGPAYKEILSKVGKYDYKTLVSACSLRSIPKLEINSESNAANCILIALDGVIGCVHVLDWFLENSSGLKHYHFILRAHPNVPIQSLKSQCLNYWSEENFIISEQSLREDLKKSFCVIYRQSSVGLQAMMNGIPAIHLRIDAPLQCDPIIGFDSHQWHAETIDELMHCITNIKSLTTEQKKKLAEDAERYAENYFATQCEEKKSVFVDH